MPAVQIAGGLLRGMEIFRAGVQGKGLTALADWRSHMSKIEAMTDKDGLPAMSFRLSRRQIISGMASTGLLMGGQIGSAFAQKRIVIPEGEFTPQPIAIPNFVAGTPGGAAGGVRGAQGNPNNPKPTGRVAP